ncbi:MAG: hypothetical protein A4S09_03190 [Proteobacteria bacterium SG_bin7]|nr:MAG: hypothetical protein A4S09_03190 [Proteobacteria bacterium SG_bin7]
MLKIILPFLVLCEFANAQAFCSQLFSTALSTGEKAEELTRANLKGTLHMIGEGGFVFSELDNASGPLSGILLGSKNEYDKDFSAFAYEKDPAKKLPAVRQERLMGMLEAGFLEIYEKKDKINSPDMIGRRRFSFADTAVTKNNDIGYMWMGVIMEFRPGEFIEFRLQCSLLNTNSIRDQKQSVGNFGINFLHSLMKIKDFENVRNVEKVLGELSENLSPGEIKINDFYVDKLSVAEGRVLSRTPLLRDSVSVVKVARVLFKKQMARSIVINNNDLVDPPQISFRRNILVKTDASRNFGKLRDIEKLKAEFEAQAAKLGSQKNGNLFVVAIEDIANIESVVAQLNSAGIAVWLFSSDAAAQNQSIKERMSAKGSYIEKFSGHLHVF